MSTTAERLAAYQEAELAILKGERVRFEDGKEVELPDLDTVRREIRRLEAQLAREQQGGGVFKVATFRSVP